MTDLSEVARTYFSAWRAKDFDTLGSLLADDVTFRGPLGTADDADSCLKGLRGMGEMITDIVVQQVFTAGENDVITWFDLYTADAGPVPTANWSHLEGGKISAIRATFDPRPLLT